MQSQCRFPHAFPGWRAGWCQSPAHHQHRPHLPLAPLPRPAGPSAAAALTRHLQPCTPGQSTQLGCLGRPQWLRLLRGREGPRESLQGAWGGRANSRGCLRAQRRQQDGGGGVRRKVKGGRMRTESRSGRAVVHPTEPSGDHFVCNRPLSPPPSHPI